MPGVFISYRREDAPGHAGRVFDRVRARFGADVVFMDVTAIDAGADFVEAIEQAIDRCDVLLAIIGPQWTGAADSAGRRRLEDPHDFNRLEIAGALKRQVRVVPVLVDNARLPVAADLPDDLQPLLRRNAATLRDERWDADVEQLLATLARVVTPRETPPVSEPVRAGGRLRTLAALVVAAVGVGAAVVFGPRACATTPAMPPAPVTSAAVTTPAATEPAVTALLPAVTPAPKAIVPDVVGRSLPEARDMLRRAGVDVARILYRDDRTKAIDVVVVQSEVRTSAGSPPAVALTAVARAAVVIRHRPEDGDVARGLLGSLMSSRATAGLAIRTVETPVVRPEAVAKVTYSDSALASTAADVAKDANAWLQEKEPGRPVLTASLYPPVVSRTIIIGVPDRGTTTSVPSPLPDVRGLTLADARRKLSAAGVTAFDYKWSDDPIRKPLEVFGQSELPARAGGRTVGLEVGARGTVFVFYVTRDAPLVERLAGDLRSNMRGLGILVRPVGQTVVKPAEVGKVTSSSELSREAASIAAFASTWLTNELGRTVRIQAETASMGPQRITFGLPSLR